MEVKSENDLSVQSKTAVAAQDGRWPVTVELFALVRDNKGYSLIITAADQPTNP